MSFGIGNIHSTRDRNSLVMTTHEEGVNGPHTPSVPTSLCVEPDLGSNAKVGWKRPSER
jgi:hypothetical protein